MLTVVICVIMLSVIVLTVVMQRAIVLSVLILSVVMQSAIILSVTFAICQVSLRWLYAVWRYAHPHTTGSQN
jgi:hypothetical protein